jgi:5-methylthioadenosine/S-adenosylhomocysteine deaminase
MTSHPDIFDLAVTGGYCLTLDPEYTAISDLLMLVRGGRIEWIGKRKDYPGEYKAGTTIDATGKLVIPAWVNAHTHLSISLYRGIGSDLRLHDWLRKAIWPLEERYCNPENVYLGNCLSLLEMIKAGTGTIADMNFFAEYAAKAIIDSGLRGVLGEALFSTPTPSIHDPLDALDVTAGFISRYHDHPLVRPYVILHAPFTCSAELYERAAALAAEWDVMTCSHVAETQAEVQQIRERYGMTPVGWLDSLGVLDPRFIAIHAVHLTDDDKAILAKSGAGVVHNPHSNMMLGSGICDVPGLMKLGIQVGLGTDSASSNNSLSLINEMQTAAKLHKLTLKDSSVLAAHTVVRMATSVNADILGLGGTTGHLSEGMSADVAIVNLDSPNMIPLHDAYAQLVYSLENSDVESLVVAGRIIMENRRVLTLDEEIILKEVRKWVRTSGIRDFKTDTDE